MDAYVEKKEVNDYRIVGTRVSLDSIIYAFLRGESAEQIQESFPTVTLEKVYGAITFYLANKPEIDEYLRLNEIAAQEFAAEVNLKNADLIASLRKAREEMLLSHK